MIHPFYVGEASMIDTEETSSGLSVTVRRGTTRTIITGGILSGLVMILLVFGYLFSTTNNVVFLIVGAVMIPAELLALVVLLRFLADWDHVFDRSEGTLTSTAQSPFASTSENRMELTEITNVRVETQIFSRNGARYAVMLDLADKPARMLDGVICQSQAEADGIVTRIREAIGLPGENGPG